MNLKQIVAIWTGDIESSRKFYTRYFAGKVKRHAKVRLEQEDVYSITFGNGPALELKSKNQLADFPASTPIVHPTHTLSFRFENRTQVDDLTQWIADEGFRLERKPTNTENGTYASIVYDPDENRVEIYHAEV